MSTDLILRGADAPDDPARLGSFVVAEQGEEAARLFERHLARPRYRPAFTLLAERGGELVGYALIGHERLRLGAATLEAGVLEDAYVRPDQRGQGTFRGLMGLYLDVLQEHALPLAILRGPVALFGPFGFAPYRFGTSVELDAAPLADAISSAARPATEDDLEDLAALYEASYRALPLAPVRVAPDWRWWLGGPHEPLVVEDDRGRVVAYAAADQRQPWERPLVVEAAAADAGAARALVGALRQHMAGQEPNTLTLALPHRHVVAQTALHLGGVGRLVAAPEPKLHNRLHEHTYERTAMAGIVDLPGVLEALTPAFEQRLAGSRYAGWSGNLRIEIETERVTLALEAGRAAVIDGSRPADLRLRRVTLPALAQLCLGYRAAADLRATGGLDYDNSALGLIDLLFPLVMASGEDPRLET